MLVPKSTDIRTIGSNFLEVSKYLKGKRKGISTMVATTPPSLQSRFIYPNKDDAFIRKFGVQINDYLSLLTIGTYDESDVGHTCYHGKLNTLEAIYHHMLDNEYSHVVADATAGIDNLGTSLFFAYDLNVFIVEPTLKSIQVYKEFKKISDKEGLHTVAIINKCEQEDEVFIHKHIDTKSIIGYVPYSTYIKKMEQGKASAFDSFIEEQKAVFTSLENYIKESVKKDWNIYYKRLLEVHIKNSKEWWNDYFHEEIDKQEDKKFSYEKVFTI
jgi:CO dehydrogenase maturation factor